MTNEELLAIASRFTIGNQPIINGKLTPLDVKAYQIYVQNTGHPDNGPDRWGIIVDDFACINKNGKVVYVRNAEKDEEFYQLCRFEQRNEAIEYAQKWLIEVRRQAEEYLKTNDYVNYEDLTNLDFKTLMKGEK